MTYIFNPRDGGRAHWLASPAIPLKWRAQVQLETLSLRLRWRAEEEDARSDVWPQMHRQVSTNAQSLKILQETLYCFQL